MKRLFWLLHALFSFTAVCAEHALGIYAQEFTALKEHPEYRHIFDENRHFPLRYIDAEIKNYPQLKVFSKFFYRSLLAEGTLVINEVNMPTLYAYIRDMCQHADMQIPIILVTFLPGSDNAAATKILANDGVIMVGSDLLINSGDEEIEAVLAHELGHIKYNHTNKKLALGAIMSAAVCATLYYKTKDHVEWFHHEAMTRLFFGITAGLTGYLSRFIINKRFEKEADEFAVKILGKGQGLIKRFTRLNQDSAQVENDYVETQARLEANRNTLTRDDFAYLDRHYRNTRWNYRLHKMWDWLYHHTPLGEHPSHESRIQAAQEYLDACSLQV